jgi:hypothetical protein
MESMELKLNTLVELLGYEDISYSIYLLYCKDNNKPKELFMNDSEDGINALFDTPFEAVKTMYDKGITPCNYNYIYRDEYDEFGACDFIEECTIIDMYDIAKWIIESDYNEELYSLLTNLDIAFEVCEKLYDGRDEDFAYKFACWVDREFGLESFIKSDWVEVINKIDIKLHK